MEKESVKYGTKTVFGVQCVNYFCRLLSDIQTLLFGKVRVLSLP